MRFPISTYEITNERIADGHLPDSDALETISFNLNKKRYAGFYSLVVESS